MRTQVYLLAAACFWIMILSGCHTGRKYAAAQPTHRQPKFIKDIYLNGHDKKSVTENGIDPTKPKPKGKPTPLAVTDAADTIDDEDAAAAKVPEEVCPVEPEKKVYYSENETNQIRRKYADILGMKQKELTNNSLYEFIDRWYGANYKLGGCSRAGIDCSGFTQKLYDEVYGVTLTRTATEQYSSCKRIKHPKSAREGDLVFFHVHSRRRITHVGVYLGNDYFIHASTSGGVMISNLNEDYWHKYFACAGRVDKG